MAVRIEMQVAIRLAQEGLVDPLDVLDALAVRVSRRKPCGMVALELKFLTVADVLRIMESQSESGWPFGSVAQHLGLLTEEQLAYVLYKQDESLPQVEEIMISQGTAERYLVEEYRAELRREALEGADQLVA